MRLSLKERSAYRVTREKSLVRLPSPHLSHAATPRCTPIIPADFFLRLFALRVLGENNDEDDEGNCDDDDDDAS